MNAKRVYAALLRLGWTLKKQAGSHRKLRRPGWSNFTFCFHDSAEAGPRSERTLVSVPRTSDSTLRRLSGQS
jgi:predicted RNA binding protein YcfA (HicA-like mRNA interferase family)